MALDLKEILESARVVAHQVESKARLTDAEYDEVIRQLLALVTALEKGAPYKFVRDKARYLATSIKEMVRD